MTATTRTTFILSLVALFVAAGTVGVLQSAVISGEHVEASAGRSADRSGAPARRPADQQDASPAARTKEQKETGRVEVTFTAADGVQLYGDLYASERGKTAPAVILFHQAGANARAEYASIIPVLRAQGYAVLAIDQRSGGTRLGGTNRTVDHRGGRVTGYCDAYPDLEAALHYLIASGYTGPRVAWGSSYSAGLVVRLAVDHARELSGILAFSPAAGGPMKDCSPDDVIDRITIPALILRPASEMKYESVRKQLDAFRRAGLKTYVAKNGVHGSSMLNPKRVEGGVEETWKVVLDFLAGVFQER